jgi:hypothetical protein
MDLKTVSEKTEYYFHIDTSDHPSIFQCIQSPWKLKIAPLQHTSLSLMLLVADFSFEEILKQCLEMGEVLTPNFKQDRSYCGFTFWCEPYYFVGVGWDWVHLVRRPLTGLLYQTQMIDDECGAVGRMRSGRGNRSIRRKPAPMPLCLPQIPHDLSSNPGSRCVKPAWAMTRPDMNHDLYLISA